MPVVCAARREDRLREVVEQIEAAGGRAISMRADVSDPDDSRKMIEACVERFGSVYSVFANAGYGIEKAMHRMTDGELRHIFEVNFFGTMHSIRPALPFMMDGGGGHVLICSSCVAKFSLPFYGAYSATKAAQNHIGRAMRMELRPHGVHVSTVHPVGTKTEFFEHTKTRNGGAPLVEHAPEAFMQRPERVARAVVKCLKRPRPEVWTSYPVWWGMAASMAMPRISDWMIKGMVNKRLVVERQAAERALGGHESPGAEGVKGRGAGTEQGGGAGKGAGIAAGA